MAVGLVGGLAVALVCSFCFVGNRGRCSSLEMEEESDSGLRSMLYLNVFGSNEVVGVFRIPEGG